jgi:hypothetical protein
MSDMNRKSAGRICLAAPASDCGYKAKKWLLCSAQHKSQSKTAAEAIIAEVYGEVGWSVEVRWAEDKEATAAAEAR